MKTELDFQFEYNQHRLEILEAIDRVLKSGRFINGSEVATFEDNFAACANAKYCVAVGNGYDALYLAYKALSIDRGSRVGIVNELHVATSNAARACGATILPLSKLILPCDVLVYVHDPANPFKEIYTGIPIIEDACRMIGSKCKIGFGKMACWSFHPLKVLHCYGDGGAITTNDVELYNKLREMRNHGRVGDTQDYNWGVNSRLDEIQAAILNVLIRYVM
jgi:dTDP-4-amino-4,6-dideoxygalactose transaminase